MNLRRVTKRTAVAAFLGCLLLGAGCGDRGSAQNPDSPVVGTWARVFEGRTVTLTLDARMNYSVDVDGKRGKDAWGRYEIGEGQLTLLDEEGPRASGPGEAVYGFAIDNDQMELTPIDDDDVNRRIVAAATWARS